MKNNECPLTSLSELLIAAAVPEAHVAHAVVRQRAAAVRAHVARVRQPRERLRDELPLAAAVVGQHASLAVLHVALRANTTANYCSWNCKAKNDKELVRVAQANIHIYVAHVAK
ncbi:jg13043 [Pararge aegeria aegeria]|uniref:Jg13043 protein n=1 Tax=Pararge aegeria aegeria TaxID=348720 RepID=A0A8S4QV63_9NEOP|nr:jg13043 [Pararge aegeria aegeria]